MAVTFVSGTLLAPNGRQETLDFLVDSGSHYTLVPAETAARLELTPRRRQRFRMADGTVMERDVSECRIRLDIGETTTPVIMGGPSDVALLGVVTLEELGVVLNPLTRTLHPANMLLI